MQRSLCVPLSSARESSQQSRKLTLKRSTSLRTASECIQRTSKLTAGIPWRQRSNRLAAHQLRIGECIDFNYEFSTILAFVSNAELQSIVPANCPHKLTKSRRAAGPAAEPASGGSNCTAAWWPHFAPSDARSVAAATTPQ